ncbi:MAG: S-layer homology domain-containing protein, partial [Clostridia bacterium]|nr:S-layer homology domain-containing protein [Clostridia bacterium]
ADFFEPETDITRGMFAYAIYRREGLPETDAANKFEDVKDGSYYETAIAWATENEIVAGYDDTHYGPDDAITREQLAAILWRYARYKETDVSASEDTNILDYTDAQDISEYAIPAIQWAVGESIITGFEDTTLRPKENANRAQMAVILNKINNYFDKAE